jgi:spore germination cell wall hydrolase CwlJ-like protein
MLRSVRAGGLAAALFAMLCGTTSPAPAQVVHAVQTTIAQVPGTVEALAAPLTQPGQADPSALRGQPLEQLATTLAASETTDETHECLAVAVYFEARGEPLTGQLAVAEVVLNRARSGKYPPDVCAVVKQPWQFSFVRKGVFPQADRSSDAWKRAVAIAHVAQNKLAAKLPTDVLWYHADYVAPTWGKRLTRQAKIGLHIFYS